MNCDRFKDGHSVNRRSRKSKRGLCERRCLSFKLCPLFNLQTMNYTAIPSQNMHTLICLWSSRVAVNLHMTGLSHLCVSTERNRRSGRQYSMSTRRMVALYDYDPRESSPNIDVEVPTPQKIGFGFVFLDH